MKRQWHKDCLPLEHMTLSREYIIQRIITMLRFAIAFFIIALIAAVFGFGGIAGAAAGIAQILFFAFLVFFVIALVAGLVGRPTSA